MDNQTLLKVGVGGALLAALCCATPALVILLGVVGLSAWAGWLDYVLIPAFVVFVGVIIYALRRRGEDSACCTVPGRSHRNRVETK